MTGERRTEEAIDRAVTIARRLAQGDDLRIRERIEAFGGEADYSNRESLAIQSDAWDRVLQAGVEPRLVFAHPAVLEASRMPRSTIAASRCSRSSESPRLSRDYDMDRLLLNENSWAECMNDIFHHALRIAPDVLPPGGARA